MGTGRIWMDRGGIMGYAVSFMLGVIVDAAMMCLMQINRS